MSNNQGIESSEPNRITETQEVAEMSVGEKVLLYAIYQSYALSEKSPHADVSEVLTDKYEIAPDGSRILRKLPLSDSQMLQYTVSEFRKKPQLAHACGRDNLIAVINDKRCPESEKDYRLSRYYDAYVSLLVKLDHKAFPDTGYYNPQYGMLKYIPDGFSDMGSDNKVIRTPHDREKIRADKGAVYQQQKVAMLDLLKIVARKRKEDPNYDFKQYMAEYIGSYVHNLLAYDYKQNLIPNPMMSIRVSDIFNQGKGVCRHIALSSTVLLQLMGIESRYQKVLVNSENSRNSPHAVCLFRSKGNWYLLDPTWIFMDEKRKINRVVMERLPTNTDRFDRNTKWNFRKNDYTWSLSPHNDIYWRILHDT